MRPQQEGFGVAVGQGVVGAGGHGLAAPGKVPPRAPHQQQRPGIGLQLVQAGHHRAPVLAAEGFPHQDRGKAPGPGLLVQAGGVHGHRGLVAAGHQQAREQEPIGGVVQGQEDVHGPERNLGPRLASVHRGGADSEDADLIVTGGAGFIGVNLVRRILAQTQARVLVLDKLTYAGNLESLASCASTPAWPSCTGTSPTRAPWPGCSGNGRPTPC